MSEGSPLTGFLPSLLEKSFQLEESLLSPPHKEPSVNSSSQCAANPPEMYPLPGQYEEKSQHLFGKVRSVWDLQLFETREPLPPQNEE